MRAGLLALTAAAAVACVPGTARAQVTLPLTVNGNLTIQSGTGLVAYTVGTVAPGASPLTISAGTLVIRGGAAVGASCGGGADCWATDFCEDHVCCCHASPGNTVINGVPTATCYYTQYAANALYGDGNARGNLFQCGNCAACNLDRNAAGQLTGKCAPASLARSSAAGGVRQNGTCRVPVVGGDGTTCDQAEQCPLSGGGVGGDGTTSTCPVDAQWAAGSGPLAGGTCRATADLCDVAAACAGGSVACPANGFRGPSYACRGANANETCDGITYCRDGQASCPAAPAAPSGTLCHVAAGPCDVNDRCDGASRACPRRYVAAGTACAPDATCTGSAASCTNAAGQNVGYQYASCQ
jgi:hypothetical protein